MGCYSLLLQWPLCWDCAEKGEITGLDLVNQKDCGEAYGYSLPLVKRKVREGFQEYRSVPDELRPMLPGVAHKYFSEATNVSIALLSGCAGS